MAPVETPKCICWPLSCTDDGCHTFVRHRLAPQATPHSLPAGISRHLRLPPAFSGWSSRLNTSFFSSSSPRSRASAGFVTDSMPFRAGTAPCNAGLDRSSCNKAPFRTSYSGHPRANPWPSACHPCNHPRARGQSASNASGCLGSSVSRTPSKHRIALVV